MKFNFFIKNSQDLLDKAFSRAKAVKESRLTKHTTIKEKIREKALNKISTVENVLFSELDKIIRSFPVFEELPIFYQQLMREYVFIKAYKRSLKNISWTKKKLRELSTIYKKKIKNAKNVNQINNYLKSYYGRVSSFIYDLEKDLDLLFEVKRIWKSFPDIDVSKPVFIFAGYPNVGKSSLINALTSSNIKVAPYPFTTKHLYVGMLEDIYLIDTPGILEKRINKMNDVERRAAVALTYLSKDVVFVIDPSLSSGYTLEEQLDLLLNLKNELKLNVFLIVLNKIDLINNVEEIKSTIFEKIGEGYPILASSVIKNVGIDEIRTYLLKNAQQIYFKSLKKSK